MSQVTLESTSAMYRRVVEQLQLVYSVDRTEAYEIAMAYTRAFAGMIAMYCDSKAEYDLKMDELARLMHRQGLALKDFDK